MGLAVSIGKDNDELVDKLIEHDSIKTKQIEKTMRLVDRGCFMPKSAVQEHAYKDTAWKDEIHEGDDSGTLHISAPCIYASVLENLNITKGMSFLNIGSGTGYLSTMVGFIIGEKGVNHGVELYEKIVSFANERVVEFSKSKEASAFEWCVPTYFVGNAFKIETKIQYDRIYCGALVPDSHRPYFCSFLKINGVLIMPYGHALQRITRKSDRTFNTRDISAVTFSHLIPPVNPNNRTIKLPFAQIPSLMNICRNRIRQIIREQLYMTHNVEFRNHSNKQTRNRDHEQFPHNEEEEEEREHRPIPPPSQYPVILFDPTQNEEQTNRRVFPVRQLFAMFARERLHHHHAARARQAAEQLPQDEIDSEDEDEDQIEELPPITRQLYHQFNDIPLVNDFGYEFVTEEDTDDENENDMSVHDLFDETTEHTENDSVQENKNQIAINIEDEDENVFESSKSDNASKEGNEIASDNSSASLATVKNGDIKKVDTATTLCASDARTCLTKRPRTFTASSVDSAPHASKIQRNSTNEMMNSSNGIDYIDAQPGNSQSISSNSSKSSYTTPSTSATPSISVDSSTSPSLLSSSSGSDTEKGKPTEISAEEQTQKLTLFHEKFTKSMDSLPLNVQMRKFLKYEM